MKIKQRLLAVSLILVMVLFSSCSVDLFGGSDALMRPPRLSGEREGIQRALERVASNFTLKYPQSGENRSAFVSSDLDGNGSTDVIVLYKPAKEGSNIHLNLIGREGEDYRSYSDIEGKSTEVHSIDFEDLDKDGFSDIIVSWTTASSIDRLLTVYSVIGGELRLRFERNCTEMVLADVTGDSVRDVMLILADQTAHAADASLLCPNESGGWDTISTALDGNAVSPASGISPYLSVKAAKLRDGAPNAVFIDGFIAPGTSFTDIVVYENGSLFDLTYNFNSRDSSKTYRPQSIVSADINNDGWIEVPSLRELPGYAEKSAAEKLYLTSWYRYDGRIDEAGSDAKLMLTCFMNSSDGYYYLLPDEWISSGSVTIRRNASTRSITFLEYAPDAPEQGRELMRIRAFTADSWAQNSDPTYRVIQDAGTTIYAMRVTEFGNSIGLTAERIMSNFSLIPSQA